MKVGVGLVTCARPDYYRQSLDSITQHLGGVADVVAVFEDGSELEPYAAGSLGDGANHGVGCAKNALISHLLDQGCDWVFLCEDDMIIDSPEAVTGYIAACEASGWAHLMFHAHGPLNPDALRTEGLVTVWPNYVGAWAVYHRRALDAAGLMDEGFRNCWEHVEHTLRIAALGMTAPWQGAADATGSETWLHEIPGSGSPENSSCRKAPGWQTNIANGIRHWQAAHPETAALVFPTRG